MQKYVDGNKVDVQPAVPVAANVNTYTFSNLEPGTRYYAKVDYTYNDYKGVPKNSSYSLNAEIFTAPGKVTGVNQIKWWYFLDCYYLYFFFVCFYITHIFLKEKRRD